MELLFSEFQAYKLQPLALRVFKILLWNSFLQKQVSTGSLQNSCSEQLCEKLLSVLKKDSTLMFYWEVAKIFGVTIFSETLMEGYFHNSNIHLSGTQWTPLNVWVGNCKKMSNCIKGTLMSNN